MLLSLDQVCLGFGAEQILNNINLTIENHDRIALIGPNGAGKTTLLNMIAKLLEPDSGSISYTPNIEIGYLRQNGGLDASGTIESEMRAALAQVYQLEEDILEVGQMLSRITDHDSDEYRRLSEKYHDLENQFIACDGYHSQVMIDTVLTGMGFSNFPRDTDVSKLSGGERTRLMLCKLLLRRPNLLILDEATNHLDFMMLKWLEEYLANYRGAILTVSHDRWFLDRVTTTTWEIEGLNIITYPASYSGYLALRAQRIELMEKEYERHNREVDRLQEYVAKNIARATTASSARSRVKMIEHMGEATPPPRPTKPPRFSFEAKVRPVSDILHVEGLRLTVGEQTEKRVLLENFELHIKRGERIAIVGENGAGKSTFLKAIAGRVPVEKGEVTWGRNVQLSYFEQDSSDLHSQKTVLEELWDRYPLSNELELRTLLGTFGLIGEEAFKRVGTLSGGERARLKLSILKKEQGNVLILDEPTNHLDIPAKEALEKALSEYEGTLIIVSHDRWLLSHIPTKIIRFHNGIAQEYNDGFEAMQQQLSEPEPEPATIVKPKAEKSEKTKEYRSKSQRSADAQAKQRLQALEDEIAKLEQHQTELENQLCDPEVAADYQLLTELSKQLEEIGTLLPKLYEEWNEQVGG